MSLAVTSDPRATGLPRALDLLLAITTRELILRYRGTLLGYVWWVARPLALGLLLWFALRKVLAVDMPNYHLFIMTGLFPWFWFVAAVSESSGVLVAHESLVKKVVFPRVILPLSCGLGNAVQFIVTLPVPLIFILIAGEGAKPMWLLGIPFLVLLQLALTIGIGLILAPLNVFFRDISPLVDVTLNILFYASAVIFPLQRVPADVRPILLLNPLTGLMGGWRDVLIEGAFPGRDIWSAVGVTVAMLAIGIFVFAKLERHVADAL